MRPGSHHVFVAFCGLVVVGGLAGIGHIVMGADGPTSPMTRLKSLVTSEVTQVIEPESRCLQSTDALDLDSSDPRLQGDNLIVVRKAARKIQRFSGGQVLTLAGGRDACWPVGLGPAPEGHKYRQGDGRTPEGWYRTSDKPWSQWYAAIAIHYPNKNDAEAGRVQKRINAATQRQIVRALDRDRKPPQSTDLGGEILIHGQGATDWTLGCVGMNNEDIDALRATLPSDMKTDVLVLP